MKRSLSNIQNDKERIVFHKNELKENRKADKVIESHMCKKELRKAKADLRRDKKYLRIDKRDLKADQKYAIKVQKKEEKQAEKELKQAKKEVRSDLRKENISEFKKDSERVQSLLEKQEIEQSQTVALKEDVDEFFALLDDEIDQVV